MKDTIETLRDVLLVFLVVMLVYILYQRLLRILGKKQKSTRYPIIGENLEWSNDTTATLEVEMLEAGELSVDIFDQQGQAVLHIEKNNYPIGKHYFTMDISSLSPAKYFVKVTSEHQQISRYFQRV